MGQIIGSAAKPSRCNLQSLSSLGTPAAGEYILVSSDNSMNAAGQGNFDSYIVGDGTTAATALELKRINEQIEDEIDEINSQIYIEGVEEIDVTQLNALKGFPAGTTWAYKNTDGQRTHISIEVSEGETYKIVCNGTNGSSYYFLTQNDVATQNNQPASLVSGTSRVVGTAGETLEITIPSGCHYLAISKTYSTLNDYLPQKVEKVNPKGTSIKTLVLEKEVYLKDVDNADLSIEDENENILAVFKNGGFKTKNFDSLNVVSLEEFNALKSKFAEVGIVKVSDFKNTGNTDDDAISDALSFTAPFSKRTIIIDIDLTIHKSILLPSNTTIILDGVTIKQADYVFDNVFRGANIPWDYNGDDSAFIAATDKTSYTEYLAQVPNEISNIENIKIIGNGDAKIIGCDTNATIHYIHGNNTQSLVGDYFGARTNQINLSYADGIEIAGIKFSQTRGWCLCFDMCENILIHDLEINSSVKNGDGIDLRYGCKNAEIYNIEGNTSDDLIACTCLPNPSRNNVTTSGVYMFVYELTCKASISESASNLNIENVYIHDIEYTGNNSYSSGGHGMICLASYGGKVQNVFVSNFIEASAGTAKESVFKIYTGYGSGYNDNDLNNIRVNYLKCTKSSYAVLSNCKCGDVWLNKMQSATSLTSLSYPDGFTITNTIQ